MVRHCGQFIFLEEKRFFIEKGLKIIDLSAKLNELCTVWISHIFLALLIAIHLLLLSILVVGYSI